MNLFFLSRRFRRLNVPGAMLLALLQRTPALRVVAQAEAVLVGSPVANVLRSVITAAASLGAIQSMAGATPLVPSSGSASGITVTVGTAVNVAYTVNGTETKPESWTIKGSVPPGLSFSGLTSPGTVNVQNLQLSGTPSTGGTYDVTITAWEGPNATLIPSPDYKYTITVSGGGSTGTAPAITTQPQSVSVTTGSNATFTVAATGSPTPTFQWQKDGANVTATNASGATTATLTLTSVQTANAGTYTVIVSNSAGNVTSSGATLTVSAAGSAPAFTAQPTSQTIANGSSVVFTGTATGATSFQWRRNGTAINGATNAILVVSNAGAADAGTYTLVATNASGSTTSSGATLTLSSASGVNAGHLSNLSVRTFSGTSDQLLNVGFAIGGASTSGSKSLLLRLTGPALAGFGVAGTMADPTLSAQPLGGATVASNDDWGGNATVASTATAVGAFPITDTTSKDAALVTSLNGGSYTAVAAGKNNGTGIVLMEIYDATPNASFTTATPRLVNVSARAQVGTGDSILIAGFVIGGSTSKTLLIRATGPTLAGFGVGGTLADPKLEVYQLNGPKLYENDNWGGSAVVTGVATSVGAFPITDANSKDAVLLVTLPPGGYTAQVSGVNNGTGIALVEVYEVP